MDFKKIKAGHAVVKQGDPATSFIVLMKGAATVFRDGETVRKFGALDYLGEAALDAGDWEEGGVSGCASTAPVRGATVTADTELQILSLTRDRFLELLLSAEDDDAEMVEHLHSAQNRATEKKEALQCGRSGAQSLAPAVGHAGKDRDRGGGQFSRETRGLRFSCETHIKH